MLKALLQNILVLPQELDRELTGLALDSRIIQRGEVFVACAGEHVHGSHYITAAVEQGAVAVLCEVAPEQPPSWALTAAGVPIIAVPNLSSHLGELAVRFYQNPAQALTVMGVTGTNGKTSCSQFIAASLTALQRPCGVIGTLGNGFYGNLQTSGHTTPDVFTVQRWLAAFKQQGAHYVAMEVSSHALAQRRVDKVNFTTAIFTNLTRDHLDYHGDMARYGAAKQRLFTMPGLQFAILNYDDPFGRYLATQVAATTAVLSYSLTANKAHAVFTSTVDFTATGIQAKVHTPWGTGDLNLNLIGHFNLSNALAVLSALCAVQIPLPDALAALSQVPGVPGRLQAFGGGTRPLVIVDYAHTPDALAQALIALRQHCTGKLWCIFGCGGERDHGKRPLMGQMAEQYADFIIVTNDNPRHEDPVTIAQQISQGLSGQTEIKIEYNRRKAIELALHYARPEDVILVAGKGHETYQQIGDEKLPFSDAEVVQTLLSE